MHIKGQYSERHVWQIFIVLEVLHNICNMCGRDLPDMSALALRRRASEGLCIHTYQANSSYPCYIYNMNFQSLNSALTALGCYSPDLLVYKIPILHAAYI